ncbi:alpha/beta fold hydrolase [Agarivorans litoreus]|uniref:alpha/beta fold hydrolase n=1 Tax=Agarivorans litoreus TaxID=1510455 RepID=UPI001FE3A7DC|nr:alpha/beta fold hydrolase [Agarivorans litoreus]
MLELHYKEQGQGYPILLIHGLFGSLANLGMLAKRLTELSYRVISVDTLNHGLSPRSDLMDYQHQAKAIKALCDKLDISHCAIVGHSMGGKIAMATAQLYPDLVSTLVVGDIAPVAYQHNHTAVFSGLNSFDPKDISSRNEADELLTKHVQELGVRQFLLKSLAKTDQGWQWLFDVQRLELCYSNIIGWKEFARYNGPCLFIKGEKSDYIMSEHQPIVIQQFPRAELKMIAGTGHWLHAEKPAIFNRLTEQFLAKHI